MAGDIATCIDFTGPDPFTGFTKLEDCPGWIEETLDALLLPGENRRVKLTRLARAKEPTAASAALRHRMGLAAAPRGLAAEPPASAPGKLAHHILVRPR